MLNMLFQQLEKQNNINICSNSCRSGAAMPPPHPGSNCRLPACDTGTRAAKLQTLILEDNHSRLFIVLSFWFDLPP